MPIRSEKVVGEMDDREYQRLSRTGYLYAFHQDAGRVPWVNLRWVRDVIAQFEDGGRSLQEIGDEGEQLAAVRQAVQAVEAARQRRSSP
jgi:hypothetical protein